MKKSLRAAIAAALILPALAMAQSAFNGTWKVDLSKVQEPRKPAVITLEHGVYHCTSCFLPSFTIKADGEDHPITGHPGFDAVAVKVVNDHTVRLTSKKNGKIADEQTMTVAPDGETATMDIANFSGSSPVTAKVTLMRIGEGKRGENAVAGSWRTAKLNDFSANGLIVTYKVEGDNISMSTPTGMSYTAKLDGPAAPIHGQPGNPTVTVRKLGSRSLRETFERDGKVLAVDTLSVAANGKTMMETGHDVQRGTTTKQVAEKQ
ncbi:MAG: hypothetical protein ACREPH_11505 [Rhodanobacteraceae bacterium]